MTGSEGLWTASHAEGGVLTVPAVSAGSPLLHATEVVAPYFWLQPVVTGAGATLVLVGASITVRQRYQADRKDQWWKRTQWALELLLRRDEDSVLLGLEILTQQVSAKVADSEDAKLIAQVLTPWVDSYQER